VRPEGRAERIRKVLSGLLLHTGKRSFQNSCLLLFFFLGCTKESPAPAPSRKGAGGAAAHSSPCAGRPTRNDATAGGSGLFVDVTRRSGIRFRHVSGSTGKYLLVETFGGGAGWLDYDLDGDFDLYLVSGHENPSDAVSPGKARNMLWRNNGDGTFTDVTDEAGVGDHRYGQGVAVGDYDNDGDPDIYVTNYGPNVLYRNNGDGTFTDVTEEAGVGCPLWNSSAAFVDVDNDGFLDLYVGSYLLYDTHTAKQCRSEGKPGYCHPREFPGSPDHLYRNRGDGTFEEIGRRAGVAVAGPMDGKALGVIATDFDNDGDQDIYVANDETPNYLYRNRGDGTFEDVGMDLGVALDRNGDTEAGMAVDVGDVNGDGLFDIHVTNYAYENNALYIQERGGFFHNADASSGLGAFTYVPLAFGMRMFDFDLDGDLDIYTACGHIMDDPSASGGLGPRQPDLLFRNRGDGTFENLAPHAGPWFRERLIGRGAAFGDYDNDGDLDIFIVNKGNRGVLLENRAPRGHYLRLTFRGTASNRDGYGARVEARFGSRLRVYEVRSARSYASACDPRLLIGLGSGGPPDEITVRWPSGLVQVLKNLPRDGTVTIVERAEKKVCHEP